MKQPFKVQVDNRNITETNTLKVARTVPLQLHCYVTDNLKIFQTGILFSKAKEYFFT